MLKVFKVGEAEQDGKQDDQAFAETTEITDPIKDAVNVSVYSVEGQVELKCDLHVDVVWELVRPTEQVCVSKYPPIVLGQLTELVIRILKSQVCQLHFVNDFFAQLGVHGNINKLLLLSDFLFHREFPSTETHLIHRDDYELASDPLYDLFIRFADAFKSTIVTLLEKNHERACPWRVVVSLHLELFDIDTLELLVVKA